MKRKALILLIAVYLFSVLGVSAKSMYCMGVLRGTEVSYTTATPLAKKGPCKMAEKMKKCCKTKKQLLKVDDKHFYSGTLDMLAKLFPVLFNFTDTDAPTCAVTITPQQKHYSHAPPTAALLPAYLLNCNYRI